MLIENEDAKRRLYAAKHTAMMAGRKMVVFNPKGKPVEELMPIYGFDNGGNIGFLHAVLLAADGTFIKSHLCSTEDYMPHDLGILEGTRPEIHAALEMKYPDGYRMEFVSHKDVMANEGLQAAMKLNMMAAVEAETGVVAKKVEEPNG